jgi:predicted RNA-binding Zn-ribbon protein involved in translation (DUF1610 family)
MLTKDGKRVLVGEKAATLNFLCPKCKEPIYKHVLLAVAYENWSGEKGQFEEQMDFDCDKCGECLHARIRVMAKSWTVTFDEYPDHLVGVQELPFPVLGGDEEWDDLDVPFSAREELMQSIENIRDILKKLPEEHWLVNAILKMAFSQTIGVMEAYLSDTLITSVLQSQNALQRLVTTDRDLLDKKLHLSEVLADPNVVRNTVRKHLREIVYHKLDRVSPLYRSLEVQILQHRDRAARIMKAVAIRHDIVHRNGKNHEGDFVLLKPKDLEDLMADVVSLVGDIEVQLVQFQQREAAAKLQGYAEENASY